MSNSPAMVFGKRPPNFDAILKVFPMASSPGVIFAYGDEIYIPSGQELPPELVAHEKVHCERQLAYDGGVEAWWERYLEDVEFRFNEELLAHRAEYQVLAAMQPTRQRRRQALKHVAKRISGPLYGRMVSTEEAKRLINER